MLIEMYTQEKKLLIRKFKIVLSLHKITYLGAFVIKKIVVLRFASGSSFVVVFLRLRSTRK